jgi:hypothetical protein
MVIARCLMTAIPNRWVVIERNDFGFRKRESRRQQNADSVAVLVIVVSLWIIPVNPEISFPSLTSV